jgi:(p)ppGpp synthase/HD superfamily hydrolase
MSTDLEYRAMLFAREAHHNQKRKYTEVPYITHPAAVSQIVSSVTTDETVLAAAWLHDVVEDCGIPIGELVETFGPGTAQLVYWLTDVSKPSDGVRAVRKTIDRYHIAAAPVDAKTIKLADLIDNTASIVAFDPSFARIYLKEKELLLEVLRDGDPKLWDLAHLTLLRAKETNAASD